MVNYFRDTKHCCINDSVSIHFISCFMNTWINTEVIFNAQDNYSSFILSQFLAYFAVKLFLTMRWRDNSILLHTAQATETHICIRISKLSLSVHKDSRAQCMQVSVLCRKKYRTAVCGASAPRLYTRDTLSPYLLSLYSDKRINHVFSSLSEHSKRFHTCLLLAPSAACTQCFRVSRLEELKLGGSFL